VLQHLPEDADLVFLDFGVNDYMNGDQMDHPERKAMERIMRYVLVGGWVGRACQHVTSHKVLNDADPGPSDPRATQHLIRCRPGQQAVCGVAPLQRSWLDWVGCNQGSKGCALRAAVASGCCTALCPPCDHQAILAAG
jgi:hypothetical protein